MSANSGDWLGGYRDGRWAAFQGVGPTPIWERTAQQWFCIATPLWVDLTGSGLDDVIPTEMRVDLANLTASGRLTFLHGMTGREMCAADTAGGAVSTPTLADMDGDGLLDLVRLAFMRVVFRRNDMARGDPPAGMLERLSLGVPVPDRGVSWGSFRADARNSGALTTPPP